MKLLLRKVLSAELPRLNELARWRRFNVAALGQVWHVHWRGLAQADANARATNVIVRSTHFQGCLTVPATAADAALAPYLGALRWESLPERHQLAILQDCADHAGEGEVEGLHWAWPVLVEWPVGPQDADPVIELALTKDGLSAPLLLYWMPSPGTIPAPWVNLEGWERLTIPVQNELGWVDLSLNDLTGLEAGDVLLPDHWWGTQDRPRVALHVAGRIIIAAVDAERCLAEVEKFEEENMDQNATESTESTESDSQAADLGQVSVRVSFDLGEQIIALEQLATIAPGYVFDLGRRAQDAVRLRVNGMRVGEGELVEIDGRLGVAITRIAAPSRSTPS